MPHLARSRPSPAPRRREEHGFGEQLANDPSPRSPQCRTDRDLLGARSRPREDEAGDIGAGDQENECHEGHQHVQRLAKRAPQIRRTRRGRRGHQFSSKELLLLVGGPTRHGGPHDSWRQRFEPGPHLLGRHPGFLAPDDAQPPPRAAVQVPLVEQGGRAERDCHVELLPDLQAEEARRADADDLERCPVQRDDVPQSARCAGEVGLPECVTQHRYWRAAPQVVGTRDQSAGRGRDAERAEVVSAEHQSAHPLRNLALREVELLRSAPREDA